MSNGKSCRTGKLCVATGCTSTHRDSLSLHEFPKENVRPNIRRQWILFVQFKRKDFIKPTANSVFCEKHFPPGSYPVEYELKKLWISLSERNVSCQTRYQPCIRCHVQRCHQAVARKMLLILRLWSFPLLVHHVSCLLPRKWEQHSEKGSVPQ